MKIAQYIVVEKNHSVEEILKEMKEKNISITFINSENLADCREIEIAAYLTYFAFLSTPTSKKIENEFLLQLGGERQINKAIEKFKPKEDKNFIAVYFGEENLQQILNKYGLKIKGEFDKKIENKKLFEILEKRSISLIKE
ncbi:MAG: KEOPS complex subunit Cgi121 [Candidatus Anstonellaceae archaeon]